jgi:hypothetical protein
MVLGMDCKTCAGLAERVNIMQQDNVSGLRFEVSGCVTMAITFAAALLIGCSSKKDAQPAETASTNGAKASADAEAGDDDLLLRVHFIGTTALMANTNAAYLTNIAAMPETAALGRRIAERFASLPERLFQRGTRNAKRATSNASLSSTISHQPSTNVLESLFADLLRDGFVMELCGDSYGVTSMAVRAKADQTKAEAWGKELAIASKNWLQENNLPKGENWQKGNGRVWFNYMDGWASFGMTTRVAKHIQRVNPQGGVNEGSILNVEISSKLLPKPVQRSMYGGFDHFSFTATPTHWGLKIRGKATYEYNLPAIQVEPVIPTNLITESIVSFTMVRRPEAWLEKDSPILKFLPQPAPDSIYFWGGESSPYQFFVAAPYPNREAFNTNYGPNLVAQLEPLATATASGPIVFDQELAGVQWQTVPFITPSMQVKSSSGTNFLLAQIFPAPNFGTGLSQALIDRIAARTNVLVFDWEFTQARIDTWFHVGQLALLIADKNQLNAESPSLKWLQAAQKTLPGGGNMFTEISQTGPRELSLDRLTPLGFSSIELFWLANWLESPNFPQANFLTPAPQPDWGTGGQ